MIAQEGKNALDQEKKVNISKPKQVPKANCGCCGIFISCVCMCVCVLFLHSQSKIHSKVYRVIVTNKVSMEKTFWFCFL